MLHFDDLSFVNIQFETYGGALVTYKKTLFALFVVFFVVSSTCFAGTTPKGGSGLINIPVAYIARDWKGSIGYFNTYDGESTAGNVSLPIGVEFAYSRWRLDDGDNCSIFSFKVPLMKEKVLKPALAIGVEDITNRFDRHFYLVMSKQGPMGFRLHLGARNGHKANGLFYGLEKQIRLKGNFAKQNLFIPVLNFTLEYDGQHVNYGMYIRNSKGIRLDFAWHDNSFRTGVQYEF